MEEVPSVLMEEEMNGGELVFLKSKIQTEQRLFFRTMRSLFLLAFMVPTVIAILFFTSEQKPDPINYAEKSEPFTLQHYFFSLLFLISLIFIAGISTYNKTLKNLKKDEKERIKILEKTWITRKYYMELNGFYYFYLSSKMKSSIRVNEKDFADYQEGDEINIEYSKYAKEFFGYF